MLLGGEMEYAGINARVRWRGFAGVALAIGPGSGIRC
jgi:hypothetical protein